MRTKLSFSKNRNSSRAGISNLISLGSIVFTIFVVFEGELLTLNSKNYPGLGESTTVRELKKIVRQRIEMTKGHIAGQHFVMASCDGTVFKNLRWRIEKYGITNMGVCTASFKPWNDILDHFEINLRLQDDRPEDIRDLLESCEKCSSVMSIFLYETFEVYTARETSFWDQIMAGGFSSLMALCVRLGMPVNRTYDHYDQSSPLSIALLDGNFGAVKELLRLNSSPNCCYIDHSGWVMSSLELVVSGVSLRKFSENKCLKYIKLLIDSKADLSKGGALNSAVQEGLMKIASYLVYEGCNVDYINSLYMTPLILAVKREDINLVRLLHGVGGASPNAMPHIYVKKSAFMHAVSQNNIQIVKYFLETPDQKRKELRNILCQLCNFTYNVIDIIWTMVETPLANLAITTRNNSTVFEMVNSKAMSDLLYQSLDYHRLSLKELLGVERIHIMSKTNSERMRFIFFLKSKNKTSSFGSS